MSFRIVLPDPISGEWPEDATEEDKKRYYDAVLNARSGSASVEDMLAFEGVLAPTEEPLDMPEAEQHTVELEVVLKVTIEVEVR